MTLTRRPYPCCLCPSPNPYSGPWSASAAPAPPWDAARSILRYKQTQGHQEARRRAGSRRGVAGITTAEQTQRAELRRAKANVRNGRRLAERWSWHAITFKTISWSDWRLLQNHWDGSDRRHLREIIRQRGDCHIKMPTLCDADVPPCTLRGSDLGNWQ